MESVVNRTFSAVLKVDLGRADCELLLTAIDLVPPLSTLQDAPEGGLWRQGIDAAKLWFE